MVHPPPVIDFAYHYNRSLRCTSVDFEQKQIHLGKNVVAASTFTNLSLSMYVVGI